MPRVLLGATADEVVIVDDPMVTCKDWLAAADNDTKVDAAPIVVEPNADELF